MIDIESPMQDTSNLRNRKRQSLSRNQKLIRRFNETSKYNEDDENEDDSERTMRKFVLQHHSQVHKNTTTAIMKLLTVIIVGFMFIYLYLTFGVSERNENSPLVKALRILVGVHQANLRLPPGTKFFSTTSVPKEILNELVYPSWPWSKSSTKYLIPKETLSQEPLGRIMRRIVNYKSDLHVDVTLLSNDDIEELLKSDQQCGEVSSKPMTMLQRYEELGRYEAKDGQRLLLIWCILYTGKAYAVMDLDRYDISFKYDYIKDVKQGKIKNAFVNIEGSSGLRNNWDSMSLATSIVVVGNASDSNVPRGMLHFLLENDFQSEQVFIKNANDNMMALIHAETAKWTGLNVQCENAMPALCIMNICQSGECCCISPLYQD